MGPGKNGGTLIPEESALHSGRIRGATSMAAGGASDAVIQGEGRWASNACMTYVKANMEYPIL